MGCTCRLCYSRMFKASNYSNHVRNCLRSNVSQSVMKLPDCNPDGSKPIISCSSIVGREIPLFSQFFDTECSFTPKEYDKGGGFTQELKASLVLVRTFANFGPNEDDNEEVKKLKLTEFPSEIKIGDSCMEDSLEILCQHAKQASLICSKIRNKG